MTHKNDCFREYFCENDVTERVQVAIKLATTSNHPLVVYKRSPNAEDHYLRSTFCHNNRDRVDDYCLLYIYENKYKHYTNTKWDLSQVLSGWLEDGFSFEGSYDKRLESLPHDYLWRFLSSICEKLCVQSATDVGRDLQRLFDNISAALGIRVTEKDEVVDCSTLFSDVPSTIFEFKYDFDATIGLLLQVGVATATGVRKTNLFHTNRWFFDLIVKLIWRCNGVGFSVKEHRVISIVCLGLVELINCSMLRSIVKGTDDRPLLCDAIEKVGLLELFFNYDHDEFNLKDLLPLGVDNVGRINRYYSLTEVAKIGGKSHARVPLFNRRQVITILDKLRFLIFKQDEFGHNSVLPSLEETVVIVSLYYGAFGTSSGMHKPRPKKYGVRLYGKKTKYVFKDAEEEFDALQQHFKGISLRRVLLGSMISLVDVVYDYSNARFLNKWVKYVSVPDASRYYVDFYKYFTRPQAREFLPILNKVRAFTGVNYNEIDDDNDNNDNHVNELDYTYSVVDVRDTRLQQAFSAL